MNRLQLAGSSYLSAHAADPVDWWPWSAKPFRLALESDRPVLLSIGYASCHWCHVMGTESFADPEIADRINELTVPIKVDRFERPDVDQQYLAVLERATGRAGWPITCFLRPDGAAFHAAGYLPPDDREGRPGLATTLRIVDRTWRSDRRAIDRSVDRLAGGQSSRTAGGQSSPLSGRLPGRRTTAGPGAGRFSADLGRVRLQLLDDQDSRYGGFAGAPKFPSWPALAFATEVARDGDAEVAAFTDRAIDAVLHGALFDHVGGGFFRYCTDEAWRRPHFEKITAENAMAVAVLARWAVVTGQSAQGEVLRFAVRTADFLLERLRVPGDLFATGLDAESGGVDGAAYTWTVQHITDALGADGPEIAAVLGIGEGDDATTPRLATPDHDPEQLARALDTLLAARSGRPEVAVDELVVTGDSALVAASLIELAMIAGRPELLAVAERTLTGLQDRHLVDGRWVHSSWRDRTGGRAADLADHARLISALVLSHHATGRPDRLTSARQLAADLVRLFLDDNGFHDSAPDDVGILPPTGGVVDHPVPSAGAAAAAALLALGAVDQGGVWWDAGVRLLRFAGPHLDTRADVHGAWWGVHRTADRGPVHIEIAEPHPGTAAGDVLTTTAWQWAPVGSAIVRIVDPTTPMAHATVCLDQACLPRFREPGRLRDALRRGLSGATGGPRPDVLG